MKDAILIADDEEVNRKILAHIFAPNYRILEAANGEEVLKIVEKEKGFIRAILLDVMMPKLDGFGVVEQLKAKGYLRFIPVILVTAKSSQEAEVKGFQMGVVDFVTKPIDPVIVRCRVRNAINLYMQKNKLEILANRQKKTISSQEAVINQTQEKIIEVLTNLVENRELETREHINNMKRYTNILAQEVMRECREYELTAPVCQLITQASELHDVGKIVLPDAILLKPGKLTADEYEMMKAHTTRGCEIVSLLVGMEESEFLKMAYNICRYHHERYDGKGYPEGLSGDAIPIEAQIVSIADVYDGLVGERVYKERFSAGESFQMILDGECGLFNPRLLNCFEKVEEKFREVSG